MYIIKVILLLLVFPSLGLSQTCNQSSIVASTPDLRFVVSSSEAIDSKTGLVWKRCAEGYVLDDNRTIDNTNDDSCVLEGVESFTWKESLELVENSSWRLPNIKELASIIEIQCYNPSVNISIFPGFVSNSYWSSSPYKYGGEYILGVDFYDGNELGLLKSGSLNKNNVILVREP